MQGPSQRVVPLLISWADPGEVLMNEEYVGQDGFGPGDREGLTEVHDVPCA